MHWYKYHFLIVLFFLFLHESSFSRGYEIYELKRINELKKNDTEEGLIKRGNKELTTNRNHCKLSLTIVYLELGSLIITLIVVSLTTISLLLFLTEKVPFSVLVSPPIYKKIIAFGKNNKICGFWYTIMIRTS